ncbi:MAG: sulfatase [Candidatus Azotimanducaceae bacterium]
MVNIIFRNIRKWCSVFIVSGFFQSAISFAEDTRPNILFIAVDDLNHWVGHLDGHPGTLTPNIDELASEGITFSRAYAAAPLCNPSRVALLTGIMPARSGVYGNYERLEEQLPDAITLPQYFRSQDYQVKGAGKIFHSLYGDDSTDQSFDEFYRPYKGLKVKSGKEGLKPQSKTETEMWAPWGPVDLDDDDMLDAKNADWIIAELKNPQDKPFFLAYGTQKPHLNWKVPRKYYDMHPEESIVLPEVIDDDLFDIPPFGRRLAAEVLDISNNRNFSVPGGDHNNVLKFDQWEAAVRGYLASITFADAQVGRVLDALAESPYSDNTIIVLWGDHGYHLGQKEHWRKHTLWEDGLRTTLVIAAPTVTLRDSRSDRVVSLVDIYPTLIELAGLTSRDELDGQSLVPLLKDPELPWSRPVVSTYGHQNHSIRTERWRYIRYHDGTEELYDHERDPNEWRNLAAAPVAKNHRVVMDRLRKNFPIINADSSLISRE